MRSHPPPPRLSHSPLPLISSDHATSSLYSSSTPLSLLAPRYRRSSLPVHTHSTNITNEQHLVDIYFNPMKKTKFMKNIVDNYFEDAFTKIKKEELQGKMKTLDRSFRGSWKGKKQSPVKENKQIKQIKQVDKQQKQQPKQTNFTPKQQQQNQLHQSHGSTCSISHFLPPIYEQDNDDITKSMPQITDLSLSVILKQQQSSRVLTFQNQVFKIYGVMAEGKCKYKVKQFKFVGKQIQQRQEKARKIGLLSIWKESKNNSNMFISQLVYPLKNILCKIVPHQQAGVNFKVKSTSFRKYLLANQCHQLKHLLKQICTVLLQAEGRVLNNKINPSNIFILKGGKVCLGEWGCSSFREQYQIQNNSFQSRLNPILKSAKQWLATPEYLSPQVLQAFLAPTPEQQPDLWQNGSSSDIWSLGLTLLQIVTMIPVWIGEVCHSKVKTKKPVIRMGIFGTSDRKISKIAQKQSKIQKIVQLCIQNQLEEQITEEIAQLIIGMLQYDPSKRTTLRQIMQILK